MCRLNLATVNSGAITGGAKGKKEARDPLHMEKPNAKFGNDQNPSCFRHGQTRTSCGSKSGAINERLTMRPLSFLRAPRLLG
jgi:hypothetical protein